MDYLKSNPPSKVFMMTLDGVLTFPQQLHRLAANNVWIFTEDVENLVLFDDQRPLQHLGSTPSQTQFAISNPWTLSKCRILLLTSVAP